MPEGYRWPVELEPAAAGPEWLDLDRSDAYGRSFADVYDRWYEGVTDAEATADFVIARHAGGPVLELGVGTGRLAGPLAARGLTVVGLDASATMLDRCPRGRVAPSGPTGPAATGAGVFPVRGDMRALPLAAGGGHHAGFGSILLAFNTLFNITERADQARLLGDLAERLAPSAPVVVEMLDVAPLLDGPDRSIGLRRPATDPVVVTATTLDRDRQLLGGRHVEITDGGIAVRPWLLRWTTSSELDAMAADAGLTLGERYGSWTGAPAPDDAGTVISVYRRI